MTTRYLKIINAKIIFIGAILLVFVIAVYFSFTSDLFSMRNLNLANKAMSSNSVKEPGIGLVAQNDLTEGLGESVEPGKTILIDFVAFYFTAQSGKRIFFDSTAKRSSPLRFRVGAAQVIPGLDAGVIGMKKGGQREIVVPPKLGYGEKGAGAGLIPPNASLVYNIRLLEILKN